MLKELTVPADMDQLDQILDFVNAALTDAGCPVKVQMQTAVAVEEVFVNKVQYAYAEDGGNVTLSVDAQPNSAKIVLSDSGQPYNPVEKAEADDADADSGLGILIIKSSVQSVQYSYENGSNLMTVKQSW
ncbi:hypothetical protein FACS1894217_08590 [Clostridia bacterium]|nr:hypothetical protein FACS1894217_08590 [Clostridia bacterium]